MLMHDISFHLVPLAEGYTLEMELFGTHQSVIFSQSTPPEEGTTLDLYSQNGPFTKNDMKEFERAMALGLRSSQTLLVLDLKDEDGEYSESLRIDCEE